MTATGTPAAVVLTPTVRQSAKRSAFWVVIAVLLVAFAVGSLLLAGQAGTLPRLSAESPAPDGGMAVAEVLRQQGVEVTATSTLDQTEDAIDDAGGTTLLVLDADGILDEDAQSSLLGLAAHLVLLEPGIGMLEQLAPGVRSAGTPDDDQLESACSLPAAENAGEVSPGGSSYRVDDGVDANTCLGSDSPQAEDAYSLVRVETDGTAVSVVGATDAITNERVLEDGNAAFALTLLGENENLVWYLPTIADDVDAGDPGLLTPGWVTPTIALLLLVAVAAAVWRGRRFGPLIVENLPVVVRSGETMEGRARLDQASSARLRALDALRLGTIARLARMCGLSSAATVEEVVLGVAAAVRADSRDIRSLLVDADPATDADLVRLSDGLLDLEAATTKATRP